MVAYIELYVLEVEWSLDCIHDACTVLPGLEEEKEGDLCEVGNGLVS